MQLVGGVRRKSKEKVAALSKTKNLLWVPFFGREHTCGPWTYLLPMGLGLWAQLLSRAALYDMQIIAILS